MDDPGLQVLPTHRLLYGINNFDLDEFLKKTEEDFNIKTFMSKKEMYDFLDSNKNKNVFGFKSKDDIFRVLEFINKDKLEKIKENHSQEYANLDVTILHKIILEEYLGIDEKALEAKTNLDYIRYRDNALESLKDDKYQAAFILNPTSVEEVKNIADKGEKMPQKSTDFYPKLLTGLVINKLSIIK
jgi:uncharacterized protein (DUF1015 family)